MRILGTTMAITIATLAAAASGCNVNTDGFCCSTELSCSEFGVEITTCTDPGKPYCDDVGDYGLRHNCIPDPLASPCDDPSDCTAERPFCIERTCVECADNQSCPVTEPVCAEDTHLCAACSGDDDCGDRPATPRCLTSVGACVECVDAATDCAAATAPICDEDTHVCRGCTDGECPSDVCNTGTGACVDEADVIYLAPGGTAGSCTQAAPCATFAQGLLQVAGSRNVIKPAAGTYGEFTVNGIAVTILGDGATIQTGANDQDLVTVTNGANVTITGLTIRNAGGTGRGVVCGTGAASTVVLRGATVSGNAGGGVSASNCTVTVDSSTVSGNAGGGVSLSGGAFSLVNNWIVNNGSGSTLYGGVQVGDIGVAGSYVIEFNTIYNNNANNSFPSGVSCPTVGVPLTLSNNIIYANDSDSQAGLGMCAFTYSDIGPQAVSGTGNINTLPTFVDSDNGDLHLQAGSAGIDAADPAATLAVDIDGDARPQGARRDMGADEVVE